MEAGQCERSVQKIWYFPKGRNAYISSQTQWYYFRIRPQKGKLAHRKNRELLNIYIYKNINFCKKGKEIRFRNFFNQNLCAAEAIFCCPTMNSHRLKS